MQRTKRHPIGRYGVAPLAFLLAITLSLTAGCLFSPRCTLADEKCRLEKPPVQGAELGLARCHYPIPSPGQEAAQ